MNPLSPAEERHLRRFEPAINLEDVGGVLGMGIEKITRTLGESRIVKYARSRTLSDCMSVLVSPLYTPDPDTVCRDLDLCREYFGDHVVATDVLADQHNAEYCIVQPRLSFADLTPRDCTRDSGIKEELESLADINRKLMRDHKYWFDFMGWNAQKALADQAYLDNVVLAKDMQSPRDATRLKLFDLTLYHRPELSLRGIRDAVLLTVQRRNLGRFGVRM